VYLPSQFTEIFSKMHVGFSFSHGNRMKSLKLYFLQICKDLSHRPLGDASKNYKKAGCTAISLRSMGQKM